MVDEFEVGIAVRLSSCFMVLDESTVLWARVLEGMCWHVMAYVNPVEWKAKLGVIAHQRHDSCSLVPQ